jgi:hypothetical protein
MTQTRLLKLPGESTAARYGAAPKLIHAHEVLHKEGASTNLSGNPTLLANRDARTEINSF